MAFYGNNIYCYLQMFNFGDQAAYNVWPKSFMVNISLDGRFLAVIVTPNPCPRHVCFMYMTKEIHVNDGSTCCSKTTVAQWYQENAYHQSELAWGYRNYF